MRSAVIGGRARHPAPCASGRAPCDPSRPACARPPRPAALLGAIPPLGLRGPARLVRSVPSGEGRGGRWEARASVEEKEAEVDDGAGGKAGGGAGKGGDGGDGGNDGGEEGSGGFAPGVAAVLASAGRSVESFPADFGAALAAGRVSVEVLERFLAMESQFITGLLFKIAGFRERLMADSSFLYKLSLECGIGIFTKSAAEYGKRQKTFWKELDFVTANVIMAIFADFLLVWLPAPTLRYRSVAPVATKSGAFGRWWSSLPDNAFQVVQPGMVPFSLGQRFGAILRNGSKLFGVGLVCSFAGVAITNTLIKIRELIDPSFKNINPPQDLVKMSFAYATYMAVSANLRYQVVAGIIEERGIEVAFAGRPQVCKALSTVTRTGNTFLGSLLWVDFIRLLGMQKPSAES
eukprot:evm.model.scf_481.3 EVM.evm.TU.scf_481.3   scf_481:28535-34166(-)